MLVSYFNLEKKLGIVLALNDQTPPSPIGLVIRSVFILPVAVGPVVFIFIALCYHLFNSICPSFFTPQIDDTQETPSITTDKRLQRGQERGQKALGKRIQRELNETNDLKEFRKSWWKAYRRFSELTYEEKCRLYEEHPMIHSAEEYANKTVGYWR